MNRKKTESTRSRVKINKIRSLALWKKLVNKHGRKVTRIRKPQTQAEWAYLIKYLDEFKCQKCGTTENLTAHHKRQQHNNRNRRFDINNGITLCRSCHDKEDRMEKKDSIE